MLSKKELQTIDYYNQSADNWNKARETNKFWQDSFDILHRLLPSGNVISLGAGTGRDDQILSQEYSYDVTSLDISKNMLHIAKRRTDLNQFVQANLYQLPFSDKQFDGMWASAVFLHIPKSQIKIALEESKRVMKSGGVGFISMWEGNDEIIDPLTNRFYARYSLSEFSTNLYSAGFSILDSQTQDHIDKNWLKFIIQNNS